MVDRKGDDDGDLHRNRGRRDFVLSPGKKIETFREWHKNESKAHKINFNLYHRYSQYNCLLRMRDLGREVQEGAELRDTASHPTPRAAQNSAFTVRMLSCFRGRGQQPSAAQHVRALSAALGHVYSTVCAVRLVPRLCAMGHPKSACAEPWPSWFFQTASAVLQ